jgi:predicted transcriptional regulator
MTKKCLFIYKYSPKTFIYMYNHCLFMLKNKKAQWVKAMARERRSAERRERLEVTKEFLKQGLSPEEIAVQLGISANTVKQYIKEVRHIVKDEQQIVKNEQHIKNIDDEYDYVLNKINKLKAEGSSDPDTLKKFIDLGIRLLELILNKIRVGEKSGFNTKKLKQGVLPVIRGFYSAFYNTTMTSFHKTLNLPKNVKAIPPSEVKLFNEMYKKWQYKLERDDITKEDYEKFVEEIKTHDAKNKIKNMIKILRFIENNIGLKKKLKKVDKFVNNNLDEFEINRDEIDKSNVVTELMPIFGLIFNLIFPGVGTLVAGGKKRKMRGYIQLGIAICVFLMLGYFPFLIFLFGCIWIWALIDSIIILNESN